MGLPHFFWCSRVFFKLFGFPRVFLVALEESQKSPMLFWFSKWVGLVFWFSVKKSKKNSRQTKQQTTTRKPTKQTNRGKPKIVLRFSLFFVGFLVVFCFVLVFLEFFWFLEPNQGRLFLVVWAHPLGAPQMQFFGSVICH